MGIAVLHSQQIVMLSEKASNLKMVPELQLGGRNYERLARV